MKTFGIVVEGIRDEAVYSTLIRRIRPDVEQVIPRSCGGVAGLRKSFVGWLRYFGEYWECPVDKVLVIRDSDGGDPKTKEDELAQILAASKFKPTLAFHFYATRCTVETWLLADEKAVNSVALRRGKTRTVQRVAPPLEEIKDAKARFRVMLSQAGLLDDPQVCGEIAAAADLDRVAERCPYFREFKRRAHAC